jgi:C-terminal processing protease CtpA/Prc
LDKKYCFFDEKDVDWDDVYDRYSLRINEKTSSDSLFYIIGEMICELRDGHVNLYSSRDVIRYWKWFEDYPENFNEAIESAYLGKDYKTSAGIRYKMLNDNIGYMTYRSFSSDINNSGLDFILTSFNKCHGIIIDIRNNSGGDLSNVQKFASRFTENKFISGYISHKTGSGHSDFSELYPVYLEPSKRIRSDRKVVVLTNRLCYSAANVFVSTMRQIPNVTIMGDKTGGGGGFPIHSELQNGWILRFSSCPTYDETKTLTENGIEPDQYVFLEKNDVERNVDTMIEAAREFLKQNKN